MTGRSKRTLPAQLAVLSLALGAGAPAQVATDAQAAQSATLIFFPLLFLSPIFLPRDELKEWIQVFATVNPTTYALDGMRALMIDGWDVGEIVGAFIAAGAFAAVMLGFATAVARRKTARA